MESEQPNTTLEHPKRTSGTKIFEQSCIRVRWTNAPFYTLGRLKRRLTKPAAFLHSFHEESRKRKTVSVKKVALVLFYYLRKRHDDSTGHFDLYSLLQFQNEGYFWELYWNSSGLNRSFFVLSLQACLCNFVILFDFLWERSLCFEIAEFFKLLISEIVI